MERHEAEELVEQAAAATARAMRTEIRQAVEEGVEDALTKVGLDVRHPLEVQRDMQFMREWRGTVQAVRRKGMLTAVGVLVAGLLAAIWLGLKALLS